MPPKNKNSVELKLQQTLDLLQEESQRNVVLGNENEALRLKISLLESALESGKKTLSDGSEAELHFDVNMDTDINIDNNKSVSSGSSPVRQNVLDNGDDTEKNESTSDKVKFSESAGKVFNISKDKKKIYRRKAKEESERIKKVHKKALQNKLNLNVTQQKELEMMYSVSKYVDDLMKAGFPDDYLKKTKWSGQAAKRGVDLKTKMDDADKDAVMSLALNNWSGLPVAGAVLRKWIINGIKQVFNNQGRSSKKIEKLDEEMEETPEVEEEEPEPGNDEKDE